MMTTYADSGVNIELGDDASRVLYEAAKLTWENRKGKLGEVVELFEDFAGLRGVNVGGLPADAFMNLSFDGVGTKIEIAERRQRHDTVAFDLFAMVCDDAVVRGAEPVLVGSILDVRSLGEKIPEGEVSYIDFVKQLAAGYIAAAKAAGVAVVNGEVAELGTRVQGYGPFNYNWGAGVLWFARKECSQVIAFEKEILLLRCVKKAFAQMDFLQFEKSSKKDVVIIGIPHYITMNILEI